MTKRTSSLPRNRFCDHLFGFALPVHLRRVDVSHAQRDTPRRASIAVRRSSFSAYQVPWPITGTCVVGPNNRCSMFSPRQLRLLTLVVHGHIAAPFANF